MDKTTVTINISGRLDSKDAEGILNEIKSILNDRNPKVVSFGAKERATSTIDATSANPHHVRVPVDMDVTIYV